MDLATEVAALCDREGWRPFMRDQSCRAAFSVPANIAEGNGRSTPLDYASFIDRARGSLFELDSWLVAAERIGSITSETQQALEPRIADLGARLNNLARSLRSKSELASRGTTIAPRRR